MMARTVFGLVLFGLVATAPLRAAADEDDLQLPAFNPFGGDADQAIATEAPKRRSLERETVKVSDDEPEKTGFAWPSLPKPKLPSLPKPSLPKLSMPAWASMPGKSKPRPADEPSTWDKINSGTKSLISNTKNVLMPWSAEEEKPVRTSARTRTSRTTPKTASRTRSKSEKKPSILSSWFSPKEEEKPIETVNDYLSLPRVPY